MENKHITKEEIERVIGEMFNKPHKQLRAEGIPYTRDLGNGGWEIFTGEHSLYTKDAGKKMFEKAVQEQGFNILNNN